MSVRREGASQPDGDEDVGWGGRLPLVPLDSDAHLVFTLFAGVFRA